MLPPYITRTTPNPPEKRAPWYKNTAPSYAGIFLWVVFYQSIAEGTITRASVSTLLLAVAVAALLSYRLYYYAPAMMGMQTGYPLYVIGSSTFGAKGGYLMPGLLMGLLQVGWFAVGSAFAARYILAGLGSTAGPGTLAYTLAAVLWGYAMAYVSIKGIGLVARIALFLNFIPLLMILYVFSQTASGISAHKVDSPDPWLAFVLIIQLIIGFFATAGAAGADFGMNARHAKDVQLGGAVGIGLAILIAAGLPLLSVIGARALHPEIPSLGYDAVIGAVGGFLATSMFLLFALASIPSACFCAFILGNSFATMIPSVPRVASTLAGVTVAIILAVTGVASNLIGVFSIVGASFGPICGAMLADYLLSGRKWAGPREGINWAGYGAWAVGFVVGILPFLKLSPEMARAVQPAAVYSFLAGFLVYTILAKAGLQPKVLPLEKNA